ncbi:class I SAM-dependent methyltransferase [candidate division KSB1 bacterium]|nr:class I SAM-dependent methyltransferase [candidate division KSB1 bacterium]
MIKKMKEMFKSFAHIMKLKPAEVIGDDKMDAEQNAQKYWNANPQAASQSAWTMNPLICEMIYRRISGGESSKHWLSWLVEDYFRGKQFESMLSIGCGTGGHEFIVAKSGIVTQLDAFDFSDSALALAQKQAQEHEVNIHFYHDDFNTFTLPTEKKYDLIMCAGSLHHVREIERCLDIIHHALKPDGYFIVNEHVGDCYGIYNERQVRILSRLLACFPQELRDPGRPDTYQNPTIQQALAYDPSESVRSKLIIPFLQHYFRFEIFRPFGGGILHPIFSYFNHIMNDGTGEHETMIRLLIAFEEILMEYGFESDFLFALCRPNPM